MEKFGNSNSFLTLTLRAYKALNAHEKSDVRREALAILGLDKKASVRDIMEAQRRLSAKNHPDQNPGDAAAELTYQQVNAARDILLNYEEYAPETDSLASSKRPTPSTREVLEMEAADLGISKSHLNSLYLTSHRPETLPPAIAQAAFRAYLKERFSEADRGLLTVDQAIQTLLADIGSHGPALEQVCARDLTTASPVNYMGGIPAITSGHFADGNVTLLHFAPDGLAYSSSKKTKSSFFAQVSKHSVGFSQNYSYPSGINPLREKITKIANFIDKYVRISSLRSDYGDSARAAARVA